MLHTSGSPQHPGHLPEASQSTTAAQHIRNPRPQAGSTTQPSKSQGQALPAHPSLPHDAVKSGSRIPSQPSPSEKGLGFTSHLPHSPQRGPPPPHAKRTPVAWFYRGFPTTTPEGAEDPPKPGRERWGGAPGPQGGVPQGCSEAGDGAGPGGGRRRSPPRALPHPRTD